MLFSEAAAEWLSSKMFQGITNGRHKYIGQRTLRDYTEYTRNLGRFFGQTALSEISRVKLREYQQARAVNVGPNKIEQELSLLRWVLRDNQAWSEELDGYEKLIHEDSEIPQALTGEQQAELLRIGARSPDHLLMYCYSLIVLDTTASKYEMQALRLCDVNRGDGLIYVKWGKNKHRIRSMPLTEKGQWAIEQLLERASKLGAKHQEHFLFPFFVKPSLYDPSRHVGECGLAKPWDALRIAAGVPSFKLNALRHTALTRYAEAGMPIEAMRALAGHMSDKMTRHYIQLMRQALRKIQEQALSRTTTGQKKPSQPVRDAGGESWAYAL